MLEQLINKQDSFRAEELLVEQIKKYPENVSLWLKLCMTRINGPIEDGERALACIEEINKIDSNNFYATILEYCIYDRIFGVPEDIDYGKLEKAYTCNKEQLSIIKYLMADYMYFVKDNKMEAVQLLKKSIELGSDFVSNYSFLGNIYKKMGYEEIGLQLRKEAVKNIQMFYPSNYIHDFTSVDEYINEYKC